MNKEQPKQIKCYCGHTTYCDCSPLEEPKQETTLEEAAEKYCLINNATEANKELKKAFKAFKDFNKEEPKDVVLGYKTSLDAQILDSNIKQETLNHIVYNIGDSIRIINPTENQPKLFTTHKVDNDFGVVYYYQLDGKEESIGFSYIKKEEPKQETLEEAAKEYDRKSTRWGAKDIFIEGAKWQQERMYSEKEMIDFAFDTYCYISELMGVPFNLISENRLNAEESFKQFKK